MKPGRISLIGKYRRSQRTNNIEHEGNESVVGSQGKQQTVNHQDVLEVVYDALTVQKVHGGA